MNTPKVVMLGPQAPQPTLGEVVRGLGHEGPVAVITAGWQEWESDLSGMRAQLGDRIVPLRLYERAEAIWDEDPPLREVHRKMQRDLRAIRRLYGRQLERAGETWMELLEADAPDRIVGPEREAALEAIQRLDAHHLQRIRDLQTEFRERLQPTRRPVLAAARAEIVGEMRDVPLVVIEGGHAAVLYNRLALFDLVEELRARTVIGCAAGAMILGERVALYNDSPAIGRGHAEIGLPGFGLVPGIVALSDARSRLKLDDPSRMRRLALRLAPDRCVLLDPGDRLDFDGHGFNGVGSRLVQLDGRIAPWGRAA